jgi:release factor H-coupled RctB family protein
MGDFDVPDARSRVRLFASSSSWIEGEALRQLERLAGRRGVLAVAGMPDLHPGTHGPVGCAALADGVVHPDVVGSDIGCGMQMRALDLPERKLRLDKAVERLSALEGPWDGDGAARLEQAGVDAPDFARALGTIGGGNHFCEVQAVDAVLDEAQAAAAGLTPGGLALLVHSGSRGLGAFTFARWRRDGLDGLDLEEEGRAYLEAHDLAVRFARENRSTIAERAMKALRCEGREILDLPHNLAEREGGRVLHRKGAAPSDRGLVPIPGSRGALTFLVKPLAGPESALRSLAHGAGRKRDRSGMERSLKASELEALARNRFGGRVICSDRRLLVEEAPDAYKDVRKVVADLEAEGLARVVATLRPVLTFKTAREPRRDDGGRGRGR